MQQGRCGTASRPKGFEEAAEEPALGDGKMNTLWLSPSPFQSVPMPLRRLSLILALVSCQCLAAPADDEAPPPAPVVSGWIAPWTGAVSAPLELARQTVGDRASDLLTQAMGLLGVPYRRGGASEDTGFDCSGFVRHIYEKSFGRLLPRRASEQAKATETIDRDDLKPGDLVFFNTMKRAFSHVGIYVGDGKFIHAPRVGKSIQVDDMRTAYWQKRFNGARRVQPGTDPDGAGSLRR